MNKKIIKILENNNWFITKDADGWTLSQFSPLGEDFFFYVKDKDIVNEIIDFVDSFDPEEHVAPLIEYRGRFGVPSSITDLVKDAHDIKKLLEDLKKDLVAEFISGKETK